jgi:Protein of unknown function (DUF3221)
MLMTGCSYGIDIKTFDDSVSEEVLDSDTSEVTGISDSKVLSGKVIKKRKKEIILKVSGDPVIGEGTIWVKVDDGNMLADIKKGQKVNVWYDYIRESNPPRTKGLKIEVDS